MRILILYNAGSGHRWVSFPAYLKALSALDARVETRTIPRSFDLKELLTDAGSFDRVVVAGGDGTVAAVAGILKHSGIPIVAYPGGTANLLARNLGMPFQPEALANVTLNGPALATDLGEIEYLRYSRREAFRGRFMKRRVAGTPVIVSFCVMAGCGFPAALMHHAKPLKPTWGEAAYWMSACWSLFPRRARLRLVLDGREVLVKGIGVLIMNFGEIQFDLKVMPGTHAHDGIFGVAVVKSGTLFGLIPLLWNAVLERMGFRRQREPEMMETYHAASLEIESRPPLKIQFDGEVLSKASRFKARVCPGAVTYVFGTKVPTDIYQKADASKGTGV